MQQLLDNTDITIAKKSSGKPELALQTHIHMDELWNWMSVKSKQMQEVDEMIRQHGLYLLQSGVLVDRMEAMQVIYVTDMALIYFFHHVVFVRFFIRYLHHTTGLNLERVNTKGFSCVSTVDPCSPCSVVFSSLLIGHFKCSE